MSMEIREISTVETYSVRQEALYPRESRDNIMLKDDSAGRHFGLFSEQLCLSAISVFQTETGVQLRKFGTLPEFQGKGHGTALLKNILQKFTGRVYLNARVDKISFYNRFGFTETNNRFNRNDIDYCVMEKE